MLALCLCFVFCPAKHYLDGLDFLPPGASGFCVSGQRRPAATQARHKRSAKAKPESCALKKTMTAADAFYPGLCVFAKADEEREETSEAKL